jgi:hypothetical protein
MKNDRFLNGLLAGIGVLIIVALVLFFVRQQKAEYRPDDAPNNVVHNYILAVLERDYERAYTYLPNDPEKPSFSLFQQELSRTGNETNQMSATIGEIFMDGEIATVQLSMRQSFEGPFNNVGRYTESAQLKKENGNWKIVSMPYPFWSWNWYAEDIKPLP